MNVQHTQYLNARMQTSRIWTFMFFFSSHGWSCQSKIVFAPSVRFLSLFQNFALYRTLRPCRIFPLPRTFFIHSSRYSTGRHQYTIFISQNGILYWNAFRDRSDVYFFFFFFFLLNSSKFCYMYSRPSSSSLLVEFLGGSRLWSLRDKIFAVNSILPFMYFRLPLWK
jgi:hypothetical protein